MSWRRVDREKPPVGQKVRVWHPVLDEIHATMLPSGLWLFQHNGSLVDAPWVEWWMPCARGPEPPTVLHVEGEEYPASEVVSSYTISTPPEWHNPYRTVHLGDCEYE